MSSTHMIGLDSNMKGLRNALNSMNIYAARTISRLSSIRKSIINTDFLVITKELYFAMSNIKKGDVDLCAVSATDMLFSKRIDVETAQDFLEKIEDCFENRGNIYWLVIHDLSGLTKVECEIFFYHGRFDYYKCKVVLKFNSAGDKKKFYVSFADLQRVKSEFNMRLNAS